MKTIYEIPEAAKTVIREYFELPIGNKKVVAPYFMNLKKQRAGLRVLVGKGDPGEIAREMKVFAQVKGFDLSKASEKDIREFMLANNVGIDCSGYVVYNDLGQFLITKRSSNEDHQPGIYSYPGGKLEYTGEEFDVLEENLKKEVYEETNIKIGNINYINSHVFSKDNGDKTCVIAYLAEYESGKESADKSNEISEVIWMDPKDIEELDTLPVVKRVYHSATLLLEETNMLHHISVAGIVINADNEVLLLREIDQKTLNPGKLTFPMDEVMQLPGTTWEMLEKNLSRVIYKLTNIEIADGAIPFTDEAFIGLDGFDTIMQFYICKYKYGKEIIGDPGRYASVEWQKVHDLNPDEFDPLVFQVFEKAFKFISSLNS